MPYALVYSSVAAFPLDEPEVDALLGKSRERNSGDGITGVLLYLRLDYEHAAFLQVLEGPEQIVEQTYRRIEHDELHRDVFVLSRGPVPALRFERWSMKFVEVDRAALGEADAVADPNAMLRDHAAMAGLLDRYA